MKTFRYPPGLIRDLAAEGRRRLLFWLCLLMPFVVIALWSYAGTTHWLGPVIVMAMAAIVAVFEWLLRRFATMTRRVSGSTIIHDAERQSLRQITEDGTLVAEIDLSKPFRVSYPFHIGGNAVYHVEAGSQQLTFSSRIDAAKELVTDVLRHDEWPPGERETA